MKFPVLIHEAKEAGFWGEVPALPGCVSEGETRHEVLANIKEAAQGWAEAAGKRPSKRVPKAATVEIEL